LARPVTSPFAAVSAMHPMYGMSRDSSMSLGPRAETHVDSTLQVGSHCTLMALYVSRVFGVVQRCFVWMRLWVCMLQP
jgi:hypothetical protein